MDVIEGDLILGENWSAHDTESFFDQFWRFAAFPSSGDSTGNSAACFTANQAMIDTIFEVHPADHVRIYLGMFIEAWVAWYARHAVDYGHSLLQDLGRRLSIIDMEIDDCLADAERIG